MPADQARVTQAGGRMDAVPDEDAEARAAAAREAVAQRDPMGGQPDLLSEAPHELDEHIAALQGNPTSAPMFAEGWSVAIADLSEVVSIQPNVFVEHAEERAQEIDPENLASVAAVSLPLPQEAQLPLQFDQSRAAWIISSANPNLRIVGNFAGQPQPGSIGLGFLVAVSTSFMQVARYHGRYLLRDGYHRAYGLLRRGITQVPVFTREFESFEALGLPPGMLSQDTYLGERPPKLPDYMDDQVAADVDLPAVQKMIVIQGLEITPSG
jgi:hypothetical protein